MNEEVKVYDEDGNEIKKEESLKEKAKRICGDFLDFIGNCIKFVKEHPQISAAVGGVAYGWFKKTKRDHDYDRKHCEYYDPRTGERWYLKKPLTNAQTHELSIRRENGERVEDILRSMRVLKR